MDGNYQNYFLIGFDAMSINLGKQVYNNNLKIINDWKKEKKIEKTEHPEHSDPGDYVEFANQLQ
jgi:hypothetical protein